MSINSVTIGGNLTRDPELKATSGGQQVLSFAVAVNEYRRKGDSWEEEPHYFDCELWGNRAVALSELLRKGDRVTVQGKLKQHRWEAADGSHRSRVTVSANDVQIMAGKDEARSTVQATFGKQVKVYEDEDIPF